MALYSLVETCNYGDLKNEMLCDRIVVGLRDGAMFEELQMDPGLTLEIAKKRVRQSEVVDKKKIESQFTWSFNSYLSIL